jgi:microcystin-dependent protein
MAGVLFCDGSTVSRTTYAELFSAISTVYGSGDGSTTFNLPDLRGEFIRSMDVGRGVDSGRFLGTWQGATGVRDQGTDFLITGSPTWHRPHVAVTGGDGTSLGDGIGDRLLVSTGSSITESYVRRKSYTRPRNVAMYRYIIYTN